MIAAMFLVGLSVACAERDATGPTTPHASMRPPVPHASAAFVPTAAKPMVSANRLCGLKADGSVVCWGYRAPPQITGFTQISTNAYGRLCGITPGGIMECEGENYYADPVPPNTPNAIQVSAEGNSTCALLASGVMCWGGAVPSQPGSFVTMSVAGHYGCALDGSGTPHCWGPNLYGEVYPPPETEALSQIAAAGSATCGLTRTGGVVCWGDPNFAPPGTTQSGITQISVSQGAALCALTTEGQIICWGQNFGHILDAPALTNVVQVDIGAYACALLDDGTVRCWGNELPNAMRNPGVNLFAPQAIALALPEAIYAQSAPVTVTGGGSGRTITLSTSTPEICTVSGFTLTFVGVGQCTITANQPGDHRFYQAAPPVTQRVDVLKAPQMITFTTQPAAPAYAGTDYAIGAQATSGLPVTFGSGTPFVCSVIGNRVSLLAPGFCTVSATQGGNGFYESAPIVTQSIVVTKQPQSLTWTTTLPDPALLGATGTLAAAGGGSGNPITFRAPNPAVCTVSGSTVAFVGIGRCTVEAAQAGNEQYAAAETITASSSVIYPFAFVTPTDPLALNPVRPGSTLQVEFDLLGDRGMNILGTGAPTTVSLPGCGTEPNGLEAPAPVPNRVLTYNKKSRHYVLSFSSDRSWSGTCRQMIMRLSDGTDHRVNYSFASR